MNDESNSRERAIMRGGLYAGLAHLHLKDVSYAERWINRADEVSDEEFDRVSAEIHERLVAGGHLRADEDPFEQMTNANTHWSRRRRPVGGVAGGT